VSWSSSDYKTGRSPGVYSEQRRLGGVHFYSFLCESVLGRRPVAIKLMYLRSRETITACRRRSPSASSPRAPQRCGRRSSERA
jgi:putative RecB family exonuclease